MQGGSEFFQVPEPIWGEFRIFPSLRGYVEGGLRIFPNSRAYIGRENVYHCELTCSVLTAHIWGGRELAPPRPTAVSLLGDFGAYMEGTEE